MTTAQIKVQEYALMASSPKHCYNCNNEGYTINQVDIPYTTEEGYTRWDHQLEQEQCQCSHPDENSIHNFNEMVKRLKGEHLK